MEPKQSKENALFEWYDSLVFALAVIVLFFVFAVDVYKRQVLQHARTYEVFEKGHQ